MIYVFKTTVTTVKDIGILSQFLNNLLKMENWNFDLNDCDNILRIESQTNIVNTVTSGLNNQGFECIELE